MIFKIKLLLFLIVIIYCIQKCYNNKSLLENVVNYQWDTYGSLGLHTNPTTITLCNF